MKTLRRHRQFVLLVSMVLMSLSQAIVHGNFARAIIYDSLASLVLLVVFFVVFEGQAERGISLLLGLPAVTSRWLTRGVTGETLEWTIFAHRILAIAFTGMAVGVILHGIFRERAMSLDDVLGAVNGFLLAGICWGAVYALLSQADPNAFRLDPSVQFEAADDSTRGFVFDCYSFSQIVGASSNVTPISPVASTLAWMQSAFGQFYLAVVVGQIVALRLETSDDMPKS